jgi:hypothetical protein
MSNGDMNFITGLLVDGQVQNVLVDVLIPENTPEDLLYPGIPQEGNLHTPSAVLEGYNYFVDFYDSRRVQIATVPCQALRVESMSFALSPDKNITGIEITTNQDMVDSVLGDIAFLYQGQALNTLNIYVYAKYANGDRRYLNQDIATSRLIVTIPDNANSNTVGYTFKISAKYYTEELNADVRGLYDDLNYASLDVEKVVKVIPDVYMGVRYLFPVPMVRKLDSGVKYIKLCIFAFYVDDTNSDVTSNSRLSTTTFDETQFGVTQTFDISLGVGSGGEVSTEAGVKIGMDAELLPRWTNLQVQRAPKNNYIPVIAMVDPFSDPGSIHMKIAPDALNNFLTVSEFAALGAAPDTNDIQTTVYPTHFRVRSILDTTFLHTIIPLPIDTYRDFPIVDSDHVDKKLESSVSNNANVPYPVLIEFFIKNTSTNKYKLISMYPAITQIQAFSAYLVGQP